MKNTLSTVETCCGRTFAAFPVAVVAFIIDRHGEFLLLKRPSETGWEVPSGAMEAGESPVEALERELKEELGPVFRYKVLGHFHASSFRFDSKVKNMLSLCFAVKHLGGKIVPGDDMAGAEIKWMSLKEMKKRQDILVPPDIGVFESAARQQFAFGGLKATGI